MTQRLVLVALSFMALLPLGLSAEDLVDDRVVTLNTRREVESRRREIIRFLWGDSGWPRRRVPDVVRTNVTSPVRALPALARVDEFRVRLAPGLESLAYHFMPSRPNGALVVVHHGHACTLDDEAGPEDRGYGLQRTIAALLRSGCGVLGVYMPHMRPGDCTGQHEAMFQGWTGGGSPIRLFLEPTLTGLNYLQEGQRAKRIPRYRRFHMIGLSGGGWTTTVYAAVDPRIRISVPVAGSIPLYLRSGGSVGDREQFDPAFYRLAGYPDLYVLGAAGRGRSQVQILVRRDDCCFGEAQHDARAVGLPYEQAMRDYEARVRASLAGVGSGAFRLEIDESAPSHMISHGAIERVILPELARAR